MSTNSPFLFESLERRVVLSAPAVPNPFLFLSGYTDGGKTDFQKVLPYYSAVGGITTDAAMVQALRAQGKLFLHQTVANPAKTVAQLVADWSAPFNNTLGGALPGGFDAIQIDEFGAYPDGSPEAAKYATALQQLRAAWPDKRIFVWSTWHVADGGPNTLYGNPANTYATLLNAINSYADRYMLEVYINEANNQISLFNPFADNIESFAPGLRGKTVFGLYIPQSGFVADDSTNVGYWGYLDAQLHTIRNDPEMATMPGAAFWVAYRSEKLTWDYAGRLVNHYFTQNRTTWFGDGNFAQLIGNPQFETNTSGWSLSPGTGGSIARVSYASESVTPTYHDDFGYASHGNYGLKMTRGTSADSAGYAVSVIPGMTYTVSAFVKAAGSSSGANRAKLSITTIDGTQIAAKEAQDAPLSVVGGPWKRILYHFAVPDGQTAVRAVLSNPSVPAGTTLYWDFIELEPAFVTGNGVPPAVSDAWFEITPAQALGLRFNESVAPTLSTADIGLINLSTGEPVPAGSMALSYAGGNADARITFTGGLADGHYRLTLRAGAVADSSGSVLSADFLYEFFVASGSAGADTYHLRRNAGGNALEITHNSAAPLVVPLANLGVVAIGTAGGDDLLQIDLANGLPWATEGILLNLGAHDAGDTLQVIGSGSSDEMILAASQISLTTQGISGDVSLIGVEALVFDAGGGNDTMALAGASPTSARFHGGGGFDTLNVNAGTYLFDEDAALTSDNLTVNIGGGSVISNASQHLDGLTITSGQFAMSAQGERVLRTRSLDIAPGAKLDLADNDLIVDYTSVSPVGTWDGGAYSGITGLVQSGRNGGGWGGDGIITSMPEAIAGNRTTLAVAEAADLFDLSGAQTALFAGETVDASAVLVKYTYGGDATLSGHVNIDDYGRIDGNIASSGSVWGYFNGDFNYDGKINIDDYGVIDALASSQGGKL